MSLETWKAEFYPIDASKVPVEDAVQHSLRKWRGLTKENLAKHGVKSCGYRIADDTYGLWINSTSCSLCTHYVNNSTGCRGCPLVTVIGGRCDKGIDAPYGKFFEQMNPLPMIEALERAATLEPAIK